MKRYPRNGIIILFVLITVLPSILAGLAPGRDFVFGGFLFNPLDGNSYLAKIQQGYLGEWQFHLPFTAETGEGHFLFLFYIFLGHLSRLTGIQPVGMFHLARMVGAACMGLSLFHFYKITLGDDRQANLAWIFALFGSGLGWVVGLLGGFTMDFWVAEAYPFLAAYANPHFPLSIALVVHLLAISRQNQPASLLQAVVGSLALAILQPFGVALLIVILGFEVLAGIFRRKPILWKFILAVGIGGLPMLVYQAWIVEVDPLLRGWNAQNITPAPAWWDVLVGFSPALIFALLAIVLHRRRIAEIDSRLMGWMAAGLVFLVLPFGLQRRFLLGFFVPLAGLAVIGIQSWLSARSVNWEKACVWLLVVSLPTNLLVLATGAVGILTHPTQLYLTRGEAYAMQWIRASTAVGAIIVASPESGLLIPAHTGRRVFYGHPYETVNADQEKSDIEEALKSINAETTLAVLKSRGADYLFWGQRERDIQPIAGFQPDLPVVFSSNEVKIYSLPP